MNKVFCDKAVNNPVAPPGLWIGERLFLEISFKPLFNTKTGAEASSEVVWVNFTVRLAVDCWGTSITADSTFHDEGMPSIEAETCFSSSSKSFFTETVISKTFCSWFSTVLTTGAGVAQEFAITATAACPTMLFKELFAVTVTPLTPSFK